MKLFQKLLLQDSRQESERVRQMLLFMQNSVYRIHFVINLTRLKQHLQAIYNNGSDSLPPKRNELRHKQCASLHHKTDHKDGEKQVTTSASK